MKYTKIKYNKTLGYWGLYTTPKTDYQTKGCNGLVRYFDNKEEAQKFKKNN
jgi:hypothetical protein